MFRLSFTFSPDIDTCDLSNDMEMWTIKFRWNIIKNTKYHTVRIFPKLNPKFIETEAQSIPQAYTRYPRLIHDTPDLYTTPQAYTRHPRLIHAVHSSGLDTLGLYTLFILLAWIPQAYTRCSFSWLGYPRLIHAVHSPGLDTPDLYTLFILLACIPQTYTRCSFSWLGYPRLIHAVHSSGLVHVFQLNVVEFN